MSTSGVVAKHNIYVFLVDGEPCGIDIAAIREVKELGAIEALTPVPHIQPVVIGYINVRGTIHQVLSLGRILHARRETLCATGLVIYFKESAGVDFGAYADSVREIVEVSERDIDRWEGRRPEEGCDSLANFVTCGVCRHNGELIHLISPQRLYESVALGDEARSEGRPSSGE